MGVIVEFGRNWRVPEMNENGGRAAQAPGFALGRIRYPEGGKGRLLYVKASLPEDAPREVVAYQRAHAEFPHETTLDQWFTESQFESYRRLGEHQMAVAGAAAVVPGGGIAALFKAAVRQLDRTQPRQPPA
jgi:hypothetical protein